MYGRNVENTTDREKEGDLVWRKQKGDILTMDET